MKITGFKNEMDEQNEALEKLWEIKDYLDVEKNFLKRVENKGYKFREVCSMLIKVKKLINQMEDYSINKMENYYERSQKDDNIH